MSDYLHQIMELLRQEYGDPSWHALRDPLSELIRTILSQHTSDVNSLRAFDNLLGAFVSWEAVAGGEVEAIARSIAMGGLARVKAPRIKAILGRILEERGSLDLSFLESMPLAEAKTWLERLPGVGPKTAACVLLFSLGRPVLPVDTHVHRVAKRLGLIGPQVSAEEAHRILLAMLAPEEVYPFHVYLVEHGRRVCKAPTPRCSVCVLRFICPTAPLYLI